MILKVKSFIIVCLTIFVGKAHADGTFVGSLEGRNVRPIPVTTSASGTASALYQSSVNYLLLNASYSGPSTPTSAVLCGPAWVNSTGSVLYELTLTTSASNTGHFGGSFTLTPELTTAFQLGLLYVQVNTSAHPEGELRAQLPGVSYAISPGQPLGTIAATEISLYGGTRAIRTNMAINLYDDAGHNITSHMRFTNGMAGKLLTISPIVQPNFLGFVQSLTNGLTNRIGLSSDINGSSISKPEYLFFQSSRGTNGLDLQGFLIDRIILRLNELKFGSSGSDPNGDGIWTEYSFGCTLFFVSDAAASGPQVKFERQLAGTNRFQLLFQTVTNRNYSVYFSPEPAAATWLLLEKIKGIGNQMSFSISNQWPHAFFAITPD
ncbi:MAG TPA: CHRD domain-containing protein [Candidatus Saccharimonadales bacterium]|nr:CHRD domain-containing protein [Candidatus Saccharimonadales bacterium]